jgi:hypothetical protein
MMEAVDLSEAERERVIRDLTRHCGDGRLTLDELEERVAELYAATTTAEIEHALRFLPATPIASSAPPRPTETPRTMSSSLSTPMSTPAVRSHHMHTVDAKRGGEIALRIHLAVYLSVIGLLVAIWFLTTPFSGGYWPIWPAMTWGTALAIHAGVHKAVWAVHDRTDS